MVISRDNAAVKIGDLRLTRNCGVGIVDVSIHGCLSHKHHVTFTAAQPCLKFDNVIPALRINRWKRLRDDDISARLHDVEVVGGKYYQHLGLM